MKRHIGLEKALGVGGRVIVGNLDENRSSEADSLTSWDNEARLLDEFRVFPLGVARNGLVEPLVGDWGAVRVAGWHKGEFEEGGRPPVQHLNIQGVDLLQLLDQRHVVVRVQHVREREDKIAPKGESDVGGFEGGERPP